MMMRGRGGPGRWRERLDRARAIGGAGALSEPLGVAAALLEHQARRAEDATVAAAAALMALGADERLAADRFPLLDPHPAAAALAGEVMGLVQALSARVPVPLAESGRALRRMAADDGDELVRTWLDAPELLDPRLSFWVVGAAAPILEPAVAGLPAVPSARWQGRACPFCGGIAQVSVIAERPGDFLGGSPRSLVCGRCAGWWSFPRLTCAACGEDAPDRLVPYVAAGLAWVRIDGCRTCSGYIKTFDLREDNARDVVPLVDDIASASLDLWATTNGYSRPVRSVAGV